MNKHDERADCHDAMLDVIAYTKASIIGDEDARAVIARSCNPAHFVDAFADLLTIHIAMWHPDPIALLDHMSADIATGRYDGDSE